jgi:hypothetical protein
MNKPDFSSVEAAANGCQCRFILRVIDVTVRKPAECGRCAGGSLKPTNSRSKAFLPRRLPSSWEARSLWLRSGSRNRRRYNGGPRTGLEDGPIIRRRSTNVQQTIRKTLQNGFPGETESNFEASKRLELNQIRNQAKTSGTSRNDRSDC